MGDKKSGNSFLGRVRAAFTPTRLIGLVLLAALLVLRVEDPLFLQTLRHQGFDFYQRMKPREYVKQPITIIDLDEESLRKYGQWPWPRTRIADLIDKLRENGAVATGFDIVFSEADRLSPDQIAKDNPDLEESIRAELQTLPTNDSVMAAAMKKHPVIVGQTSVRSQSDVGENTQEIEEYGITKIGEDPLPFITPFPNLVRNMPSLEASASGHGVFSVTPDPDGIYRRVPLIMRFGDKIRLALSAETLRIATGGFGSATKANEAGLYGVVVAGNLVPTDRRGMVWPYFSKSLRSRYVSAGAALDGTADYSKIAGHILLVGTSAVGLEDTRATPLGVQMPGVEIHAQVIENILTGQMLVRPPLATPIELAIALVAGLLIIIIVPKLGAIWSFVTAAGGMGIFVAGSVWMFVQHRTLIDPIFPILVAITLFILAATANYIREERQKRQIRGAFGQYLSPALVDQLSDDPDLLVLGGETRKLSVLFTDVRGFTTISESYREDPQGLTRLMNKFLTVMSQPILDLNGTIDKYMGDAVMAFWNAPVDDKDHAYNACMAGLEMIENVRQLNETRAAELKDSDETYHAINIGAGINTGDCVVGNMGSDTRFDYTALGDTVNLASRLEGQSKPYGLPIIIGEGTADVVSDRLATFEVDLIRVKGKNEPARIFALAGDEAYAQTDEFKAMRAMNATMIAAYRNQDWQSAFEAMELLEGVVEKFRFDFSEYLFIYETRIAEFRANPPGSAWDGVYTATSK